MKDGNCGDDRRLCEKCFGVVIMRNEIQITNLVVKITEFQFRTLTWQHKVIFGHSNSVHVATKPL
jgi:hypothetical protein